MRGEWTHTKIGEIATFHDHKRIPLKRSEREKRPGDYPYWGASGVIDYIDDYIFDGEYVLVSEDGANLETRSEPISFLVEGQFWANNHIHVLTGKNETPNEFLHYLLKSVNLGPYLTGATRPKLTQRDFRAIEVVVPPVDQQREIGNFLRLFDDQISVITEMNQTLESIAQAIFKSWFIDFDPVVAKSEGREPYGMDAETAALFPESFKQSEIGQIPVGWKVKRLGDVVELAYGKGLPKRKRVSGPYPVFGSGGKTGWHEDYYVEGPGIVVGRKGSIGTLYRVHQNFWPIDTTFYVVSKNSTYGMDFLYYTLKQLDLENRNSDSAVPGLNRHDACALPIVVPDARIVSCYERTVKPLFELVETNKAQNLTLGKVRDTLLPKLMSGEIRVAEAEEVASEVV